MSPEHFQTSRCFKTPRANSGAGLINQASNFVVFQNTPGTIGVGGGGVSKPKLPTSRWAGPRILAAQPYPSVLASASLSIARCVSLAPSLSTSVYVSLYFSIQLSFQPVCDLKRPRRNRTAGGELINLSLPHRPAINRSSSCRIHKHSHPSRPAAGFQKTPDAVIRTPPVQFFEVP
jgi:hypothetical protein